MGFAHRVPDSAREEAGGGGHRATSTGGDAGRSEAVVRARGRPRRRGALSQGTGGERGEERARASIARAARGGARGLARGGDAVVGGDGNQPAVSGRVVQLRVRVSQIRARGRGAARVRALHADGPRERPGVEQRRGAQHSKGKPRGGARRAAGGDEAAPEQLADVGKSRHGRRENRPFPTERQGPAQGDGTHAGGAAARRHALYSRRTV